jgi:hypothetical protein
MSVDPTPGQSDAGDHSIQLTLTWPQAKRLRITLPWLLRALDDRATLPPRQRERRREARASLEHLLNAVSTQLREDEPGDPARSSGTVNV